MRSAIAELVRNAGYIWLGFANSLWTLFIARSLAGIMAGNIATAQAYIVAALGRIGGSAWAGASFMKFGSDAPFWSGSLVILVALTFSFRVTKSAFEPKKKHIA